MNQSLLEVEHDTVLLFQISIVISIIFSNRCGPLSTSYFECVALYKYFRELLSLKNLIKEVIGPLNLDGYKLKFVLKSTVYK